jgi:DNA adenine methylase
MALAAPFPWFGGKRKIVAKVWERLVWPFTGREAGGTTAVFLDPPYTHALHDGETYGAADVATSVAAWALEHGGNPALRIALCGYGGEHEMPGWTTASWTTGGGYAQTAKSQSNRARENAKRETVWFSPHCLTPLT